MIQLLFSFIFAEMALIVLFVFKTPLRKLVIMGLDRVKRGRGPIVVKTVGGTVFAVMVATIYNVVTIQRRSIHDAEVNPTDQLLLAKHLLEASLMGFSLFLALMIDRLHHYIRELRIRRKSVEVVKKQNRTFEDATPPMTEEIKVLEDEMSKLRGRNSQLVTQVNDKIRRISQLETQLEQTNGRIRELETQLEHKSKEVGSAEASAIALKKQSEGFLLEYDRLLEENQSLRNQLRFLDRSFSRSESKKIM